MAGKYDVVISLLVYNQPEVTRECIESLFATSKSNFLLVISDNNSRPETSDYLKSVADLHENVIYVRNDENVGFIRAHNSVYAAYSGMADYFCVLNNDLVFKSNGWDKIFISALESSPAIAQVGPVQAHGYINAKGIGIPRPVKRSPPEYIGGSCFVAKVAAIGEKLFESKYMKFAFAEDADLSFRLRASGKQIKEIPGVEIQHKHHVSFKNEKLEFDFKAQEQANQRFLIDRWQKYMRTRSFTPLQILIIRTRALGDSFMVEPVARELVNKYPGAHVYIQTACPEWFTPCDYIKECGPNVRQKRRFDIVIDLDMAYERNPKMHIVDAYAKTAMIELDEEQKTPRYLGAVRQQPGSKIAVINAEGSWDSRQWPLDRIKDFAAYLKGRGYHVKEVGRTQALYTGVGKNLIGGRNLATINQIIADADLYFGMDGGLAHFAQAVGTPALLIFGCTNPKYRVHPGSKVKAIWRGDLPCSGCHHDGPAKTFTACKTGNHECLTGITVDQVIREFEAWI